MAATPYFPNLISADSHVMEPYDIWSKALGQKFGDRTPRLLDTHQGRQGTFFYSGNLGAPVTPVRNLLIGADRVLWGSDFPHIRSIGLEAQEHVHTLLGALPRVDQEKVVGGSAAQVFAMA